jgi:dTDP-glucose 4,6-dehydratase
VIPTIITQLANGQRQIKLGAVHPTRDFNYVADTVAGFLAALRSNQGIGEVINLGSNFEISIKDTAQLIADEIGVELKILSDEQRLRPDKSEVERLCADNTKAKQLLNWSPRYNGREGLRKGLKATIDWYTKLENLSSYKVAQYTI